MKIDKRLSLQTALDLEFKGKARLFLCVRHLLDSGRKKQGSCLELG